MLTTQSEAGQMELVYSVERFLYQEARLLDERRYREWLTTVTEDVFYYVPTRYNRMAPPTDEWEVAKEVDDFAYMEDDLTSLTMRVERLYLGSAWAEVPRTRTRHLISNVEVLEFVESWRNNGTEVAVNSNFLLYRSRIEGGGHEGVDILAGVRSDRLRRVDDRWKLCIRNALLDSVILHSPNMSFFL